MSDSPLIAVVLAGLLVLLVVQVVSARAAWRIGGRSSKTAIAIRIVNAVAVAGVLVWALVDRFGS